MKLHYFIFITIIFLISCRKETPNENPPLTLETKLKSIIYLDTTKPSPRDTFLVQNFFYDVNNRITKVTGWQQRLGVMQENEIVDYFYSGNDTLSNRYVYKYIVRSIPYTIIDEGYFFYDISRKLTKDSSSGSSVMAYTYLANGISVQASNSSVPNSTSTTFYGQSSNAINNKNQTIETASTNEKREFQFYYDSKINPVYKTRPFNPVILGSYDNKLQFLPDNNEQQKNNIVKKITKVYELNSGNFLFGETRDFIYEFNAAGQPTILRIKSDNPSYIVDVNKYIFIYE